jgi:adenine/guanine phosphoribosyltransferase-like PRPP-binding protein
MSDVDCFVLKRVRRTASQVGLTADQRRRTVAGTFKVNPARAARVKGKRIVVIDDVITTGETAEACARALQRAGAARVDVLALARAVEPTSFVAYGSSTTFSSLAEGWLRAQLPWAEILDVLGNGNQA